MKRNRSLDAQLGKFGLGPGDCGSSIHTHTHTRLLSFLNLENKCDGSRAHGATPRLTRTHAALAIFGGDDTLITIHLIR